MPLTEKGNKILHEMEKSYRSEKKGKEVFYASKNAGKITGVDADPIHGYMDAATRGDSAAMQSHADRMKK